MVKKLPNSCKVVVIGGGVIGCSVAYHLAKFGWKDTILLERDQLTSGTTWHAAGLVSQLGPSAGITKIRKYTLDLYKELEKKVDHSAGLRLNGALSIAENQGRWEELKRQATTAQLYDVDLKGPVGIILGGEEKGLRQSTERHCDIVCKIPMVNEVESLNVSVATGIYLFETLRQRL